MSGSYHSDVCRNCQQLCKIGDPSLIRATGDLYHKDCFNCDDCQCSIINKFYVLEMEDDDDDDKTKETEVLILCEKDYYQRCKFKCQHCTRVISDDNYKIVGAYKYHPQCLSCPGCTIIQNVPPTMRQKEEEKEEYFDYNGHPYCRYHYSFIKGVECNGCGQTIFYQSIEARGQENDGKWHPECYIIQKYWQVQLKDLQPNTADLSSLNPIQLLTAQNESSYTRDTILKTLSNLEDTTSAFISKLLVTAATGEMCNQFAWQINILFSGLDRLYTFSIHHDINLPCDADIQLFSDEIIYFLNILSNTPIESREEYMKMANKIIRNFKDLVRFGLQQAFILERNFGEEVVIEHFVKIFLKNERKQKMDMICLEHNLRIIEKAITRFGSHGIKKNKKTFEFETSYKSSSAKIRPPLFPISQRMVNSTSNINLMQQQQQQQYQKSEIESLKSSKSITQNNEQPPTVLSYPTTASGAPTRSSSRMESIRRALTTTRKNNNNKGISLSATPSLKSHRDQKPYSLHPISTPPLSISLPDLEKEHTPPLSPPSANQQVWIIPSQLADITLQQDSIVRHVTVLYMEEHVVDDNSVMDELLSLLESKKASSLWGKLKTHIMAGGQSNQQQDALYSKKIGISLTNLTMSIKPPSIHQNLQYIEKCKIMCPPIIPCFSENALIPGFLRDCILAVIDKDLSTEGIFRKNGNIRGLKEMCETLDSQPERENWVDFFKEQQIVQLAAFIKRFLRELPEPILTFKLHKLFLLSINHQNEEESITLIHYGICILPKINRDILLLILGLLFWVSRHADDNKMNIDNLARVMAPSMLYSENSILLKKPSSSANIEASAGHGEIRVISFMIQHYERIVKVPSDFSVLLQHPKMLEYISSNNIDFSSSKHFIRTYSHLMKVKRQVSSVPTLPPSPSLSTNYQ